MQRKNKVLVTGANGYIGRHVVQELLKRGITVYAVDVITNQLNNFSNAINQDIFSGENDLFNTFGCPDVCIHLAWRDGFSHNSDSHMNFLSSHYEFIKNMIDSGLKHLVVMGSMHEIGYHEGMVDENTPCNPISMYGIAKDALRRSVFALSKRHDFIVQWLRGFYVYGDDEHNHSIFTKILQAEKNGQKTFPFTSGKNLYDFIHVDELAQMVVACALQDRVTGIINCCSGKPISLATKVEMFINENNLSIRLDYGAFPERPYDSPAIWGDNQKIQQILLGDTTS